jgi:hypothetical protein
MTHKNPDDAFSLQGGGGSEETGIPPAALDSPPPNPMGGKTLVVDPSNPQFYPRPSAALKEAGPNDQVFVRAGIYEDRIFLADNSIQLIGAGRDHVQIYNRRSGTLYLQQVQSGRIEGITFRYLGSDQHSPVNILDSTCIIKECRAMEGILSGIVIYGSQCRPTLLENEVCRNRESGIFSFAGAQPYLTKNRCFGNYHFGIAVRDEGTRPDIVQNICQKNLLSGMLLFHSAKALLLDNRCQNNSHWGLVTTPECQTSPDHDQLIEANILTPNPRGSMIVTTKPLAEIGR